MTSTTESLAPRRRRRAFLPPTRPNRAAERVLVPAGGWLRTHRRLGLVLLVLGVWVMTAMALRAPGLVIGVLFLTLLGVLFLQFPERALIVLLFLEPFHEVLYSALTNRLHVSVSVAAFWKDGLIAALFLRGLVDRLAECRPLTRTLAPGDSALLIYVLLMLLIAVLSPSLENAGYQLAVDVEGPLLFLSIVLLRPSRRTLWIALGAMLAAGAIMGATALIEQIPRNRFDPWFGGAAPAPFSSFLLSDGSYRSGSFVASPLIAAFYLSAVAAVATGVATGVRGRWRLMACAAVGCAVGGVIVTFTRSGYIGAGIGILVAAGLGVVNPRVRLAILGLTVVLSASAAALTVSTGDERLSHSGEGQSHLDALQQDLDLFAAQPFGYGLGTFDAIAQRFNQPGASATESTLFSKGLQGGIEALGLYLVVLFWTGMRVRAVRRRAIADREVGLIAVCSAAIGAQVAVFAAGLFLGVEALPVEVVMWATPGIAIAMSLPSEPAPEPEASIPSPRRQAAARAPASPLYRVTFWK